MTLIGKQATLIKGFLDGLKPEPLYSVSEWADAHRFLDPKASSEPGRWRTSRTPYLKPIMDSLSAHSEYQEVVFMAAAQVGKTETGLNWLGYIIDAAPGPTLMVNPNDDTVKKNSKQRISPMIESTPRLRQKVAESRSRDSSNTINFKEFPGGVLMMTGANSGSGLRAMPVRYLFLDEVDAYPLDVDGEGSPVQLAEQRTKTFAKRKIYKVSTPTNEGTSVIAAEFYTTDQNHWHVPCPDCGHFQQLKFENLIYERDKPEDVRYACEGCGTLIEERQKTDMLAAGKMVPHAPENTSSRRIGFHVNSLYAPFGMYSWADAVRAYLAAENNQTVMKVFVNTILGLPHSDKGDAPDHMRLYERRESYQIGIAPNEVCFITVGADVQKDRIECEVVGWGRGKQSWSIDYRVFSGDTADPKTFEPLRAMLSEQWRREDGRLIGASMIAIDSGYNTQHVYDFVHRAASDRLIAIKGQDKQTTILQPPKVVNMSRGGKKVGHTKVWQVGVSVLKSELYANLNLNRLEDDSFPDNYCHFPQYSQDYFKGLTAEELRLRVHRGMKKYEWWKTFERNEPLDCRIYARAAAAQVGIDRFMESDYDKIEKMVMRADPVPGAQKQKQKRKKRRNDWLD